MFSLFSLVTGVVHTTISLPHNYSIELEETLRTELFTNYTVQQRPSQQVKVGVRFSLLTVNDLVCDFKLFYII